MRMLNLVPAVLSLDSMKFHGKSWLSKQRILMQKMDQTWRPESVAGCDPFGQRLPENNFCGFKKMALIDIYIYYYNRLSTLNTSYIYNNVH